MKEPFHCALFALVVIWLLYGALLLHPIACALVALAVALERYAEFLYRADHPRGVSVLKGDRGC